MKNVVLQDGRYLPQVEIPTLASGASIALLSAFIVSHQKPIVNVTFREFFSPIE
jgi:hypothetical protein